MILIFLISTSRIFIYKIGEITMEENTMLYAERVANNLQSIFSTINLIDEDARDVLTKEEYLYFQVITVSMMKKFARTILEVKSPFDELIEQVDEFTKGV
jgi:hypothetical protein